ncbi:phoU domain protein [Streptococcus sanguinis]|nr:phoU domain protein [Streptococcus sanguinis]
MGRDVKNFVEETLNVYLNGNVDQAYAVAAMDEKINQYFDDIRDLATEEIKQNRMLTILEIIQKRHEINRTFFIITTQ